MLVAKALDQVKPGSGSWREMDMDARMLLQPSLDHGMFVRRVVVANQMQFFAFRRLAVS